jgi:hypothetical protein
MSETVSTIRPGEVEIDLAGWGRPIKLVPSITAATNLSRRFGGFQPLMAKLGAFDFDAYVAVIAQGASMTEKGIKKLPDCVYQTGVLGLAVPLIKYVSALSNGGKPPGPAEDEDAEPAPEDDDPLDE